ncbi:MAG TPA: hypothetical protein VF820_03885 [Patescibacteria group bacterium]
MLALSFLPKKSSPSELSLYLKKIHWHTRKFTSKELEVLLVNKLITYLQSKSISVHFICDFSKEIERKIGNQMNAELLSMTTILNALDKKIRNKEIQTSNNKTIKYILDKTQKIATGKSFIHS